MRFQDIYGLLRKKPFTVYTTDGVSYTIQHPELALLGRHFLSIGIMEKAGGGGNGETIIADRLVDIDLIHVVRVVKEAESAIEEGPGEQE